MSCCLDTTSGESGGGGGSPTGVTEWTLQGEVDFRQLTPTVFAGDGTFVIGGYSITILNYANSNANMVISASGLTIGNPGNVSRTITAGTNTGPQARLEMLQIWPGFDPQAQLFLMAELAFPAPRANANGQNALMGIFLDSGNPSSGASRRIMATGNRFQPGPLFQGNAWSNTGINASALPTNDPNFLGLHIPVESFGISYALPAVSTPWPTPESLEKAAWMGDPTNTANINGFMWKTAQFICGLANVTALGTPWQATYERISIWAR